MDGLNGFIHLVGVSTGATGVLLARYELARAKEREDQEALRKDEDKRKIIIEEERRRLSFLGAVCFSSIFVRFRA